MEKYHVLEPIGSGSQGTAYLVKPKKPTDRQNLMVLKKIPLSGISAFQKKEAYTETKVLMSLRHENIIEYVESFEEDGSLHLVMEYADSGDLGKVIAKTKELLPERDILNYFVQLVAALSYCHGQKVLHRDLKTDNVFLTNTYLVKLGDFGICRQLKNTCEMATTVVGTPSNLSPELIENLPYNAKSDIWALGCILYELCTLTKPFRARSMAELVMKITNPKVKPISNIYSVPLRNLVNQMLSLKPEDRPSPTEIFATQFIKEHISKMKDMEYLQDKINDIDEIKKAEDKNLSLDQWINDMYLEVDKIQKEVRGEYLPNKPTEKPIEDVHEPPHKAPKPEVKEKKPSSPVPATRHTPYISIPEPPSAPVMPPSRPAKQNKKGRKSSKSQPISGKEALLRQQAELEMKREKLREEREAKKLANAERDLLLEQERLKNAEERRFCLEQRRKAMGVGSAPIRVAKNGIPVAAPPSTAPAPAPVLLEPHAPLYGTKLQRSVSAGQLDPPKPNIEDEERNAKRKQKQLENEKFRELLRERRKNAAKCPPKDIEWGIHLPGDILGEDRFHLPPIQFIE